MSCAARSITYETTSRNRYVEQLETLKSQEKTITRNAQVVEQMYALLAQYDVKAPSEDMVQVDDLRTIQVGISRHVYVDARGLNEVPEMSRRVGKLHGGCCGSDHHAVG